MRTQPFAALVLFAAACAHLGSSRPSDRATASRPAPRPLDAPLFFETTTISGASFSADERQVLYSSDESGVFNVYLRPIHGGDAVALTSSTTNAAYAVSMFPEDDRALYTSDRGGNELNHLYVREADGTAVDLTPGERVKAQFLSWSGDSKYFFVATNERDPRYFDLYRYAASGRPKYHRERVFTNTAGFTLGAVSRGGRFLVNGKSKSNADSDLYLFDLRGPTETPVHLTPHEGDAIYRAVEFAADDTALYVLSDRGGEYQRLWRVPLGSAPPAVDAWTLVHEEPWDVSNAVLSFDGSRQAILVNADARTELRLSGVGRFHALPASVPRGQLGSFAFSRSGRRAALTAGAGSSPANLYVWDLDTDACQSLTHTLGRGVSEFDLVEPEVVRYRSFDGLPIPAVLYKPPVASAERPAPAIVWVHGGPGGQSVVQYSSEIQFLVNHGYAILAVNNRGSSGYGKTFHHMDDRRHGDVDLKDCVYGRRYLETLDWIDRRRVAIMGGSYGGYMVAAALAFEPDAFDAGVDIFGVTNWTRTLESIPSWWEQQRQALYSELGDPAVDAEALRAKSPLFHAERIRKPLLIVQGKNDPRVLEIESRELAEAVFKNGVPVEFVLFDDEGHGFRRKENRIRAVEAYLAFLDRHLRAPNPL
jgi:prolyl oligopeptidase